MSSSTSSGSTDPDLLATIYRTRFDGLSEYRDDVWRTLIDELFRQWIPSESRVLDVGCGHGEFINNVRASSRTALDLNPESGALLDPSVHFFEQDCTQTWPVAPASQSVVFSSNFIEHLPSKDHVTDMFRQAFDALEPGGRIILLGPNLRFLVGEYWDFFDHHVALTDRSVAEALTACGFSVESVYPKVLPYSMSSGRKYPMWVLKTYLRLPVFWKVFGRQFLVVATKPHYEVPTSTQTEPS